MFFWHIGLSISFFRFVFKDFSADLRCLIVGVLIPEFLNIFNTFVKINPEIGHTLLFAVAGLIFVMIFTKRDTKKRKNLLLVCIGIFFHYYLTLCGLDQKFYFPHYNLILIMKEYLLIFLSYLFKK